MRNNLDGSITVSVKIPVRYFYGRAVEALCGVARETKKFTVVNVNEGQDVVTILPASSLLRFVIHVWVSVDDYGDSELRVGFMGPASYHVKDILKAKVFSELNVTLQWNKESKLWQSKPKDLKREGNKQGEDDIVDFDKIQAVSNLVMTLGTNYKKNLSQVNPGILAQYPDFLAEVEHE